MIDTTKLGNVLQNATLFLGYCIYYEYLRQRSAKQTIYARRHNRYIKVYYL